jgi:hypothetical protein
LLHVSLRVSPYYSMGFLVFPRFSMGWEHN